MTELQDLNANDTLIVWLDRCISKLGSNLWLGVKNMQLCKVVGSKYIRGVSDKKYKMENYDDKTKCKAKDWSCGKMRKYLIVYLKEYNIQ